MKLNRRIRKLALAAGVVAAVPLALTLLLNLLLNSGLFPLLINQHPEWLQVKWRRAWTVRPGRVEVRDFSLRAQAPDMQLELTVDEARTQVAFGALLRHVFQTRWVEAKGVSLRFRPRIPNDEEAALRSAPFPPIQGLKDSFLPEPGETFPPPGPWKVQMQGIHVSSIRELWFAAYRWTGRGETRGEELFIQPPLDIHVGPAQAWLHDGQVHVGDLPVMDGLRVDVATHSPLKLHDPQHMPPKEVLRALDASVLVDGQVRSIGFLGYHFPIEVSGGASALKLVLELKDGVVAPGTHVEAQGEEAAFVFHGYAVRGAWSVRGDVHKDGSGPHAKGTVEVGVRPVMVMNAQGSTLFRTHGISVKANGTDLGVDGIPKDARLSLELAQSAPFPLRRMNMLIGGSELTIQSGDATVGARLWAGPGAQQKDGFLTVRGLGVHTLFGKLRARGDGLVNLDLTRLRLGRASVDLSGSSVALTGVEVLGSSAGTSGWNGKVELQRARLSLKPTLKAEVEVSGQFSNARPFLAFLGEKAGLPAIAIPFLEARGLKVSGEGRFAGGVVALRNLHAKGDGLEIRGLLDATEEKASGLFLVNVRGIRIALAVDGDKVQNQLFDAEGWYKNQLTKWEQARTSAF